MTQTTTHPAQLAPVRIGAGTVVHLGSLSCIKGPNGEPRYVSWCPASRSRGEWGKVVVGEAIAEEITCRSCRRQAPTDALPRAAATAEAMVQAANGKGEQGMRLWKDGKVSGEWELIELSEREIAERFLASKYGALERYPWPVDRALAAFIGDREPDGLSSEFEVGDPALDRVVDLVLEARRTS